MAKVVPAHWQSVKAIGAFQREIETLERLANELPDEYTVFHGVHWTRVEHNASVFGEIDFAVLTPGGRVLLIEQKAGFLEETDGGLVKHYGAADKNVVSQLNRNVQGLQSRFSQCGGDKLFADYLLYCPDYTVKRPDIAGLDPARIVDAKRKDHLPALIRSILPLDEPAPLADRVKAFLGQELSLVPEIGAIAHEVEALHARLSGGLAVWGRKIRCNPFRVRIIGTAGSGKSQLALAALNDAVAAGRRALYVCYNRPLADHMALIAPSGVEVATYHQLCDRLLRSQGILIDFTQANAFSHLESKFAAATPGDSWHFDELIIDEGQDFRPEWLPQLLRLLKPEGRAWWLEDPLQNLYGRPHAELPGWVELHSDTNYRSPQDILSNLRQLRLIPDSIEPGSPLGGSEVEILTYNDARGMIDETKQALTQGLTSGFKRPQMAVVTWRGREHSQLLGYDQIGPHKLRSFSGNYDLLGNPIYGSGDILTETVYRFKGQAAPYIVFTEIDFEAYDETVMRKLFVGATRATMKLTLVISNRAAEILMNRVGND
jgi:hypothetical protein